MATIVRFQHRILRETLPATVRKKLLALVERIDDLLVSASDDDVTTILDVDAAVYDMRNLLLEPRRRRVRRRKAAARR